MMDVVEKLLLSAAALTGMYIIAKRASGSVLISPGQAEERVMKNYVWLWKAGVERDVEPAIIAALIDVESAGDPDAIGAAGEVGLMQILPSTGQWICGLPADRLKDPYTNVMCGTQYLRYCLDQLKGNVAASLCAYNAGPRNVWVDESREGKIVAPSASKSYSIRVMERVPGYRERFRQEYPTYYGLTFRPDKWFLNFDRFD